MATPTKPILSAPGGRRRLVYYLPNPPLAPNGEPQLPQGQHDDSGGGLTSGQSSGVVMLFLFVVVVVIALLCKPFCKKAEEGRETITTSHEDSGGGEDRRRARRQRQQQRQAAAAVPEVVVDIDDSGRRQQQAEPALECTYRAAEGWEERTCSVCLAELQDGEVVRMLMPCTHYFHAACVDKWMRKNATCPICRAPTVAAAKDGRRRRT
ncbi:unnamed protein product [Urochloa humidicola]